MAIFKWRRRACARIVGSHFTHFICIVRFMRKDTKHTRIQKLIYDDLWVGPSVASSITACTLCVSIIISSETTMLWIRPSTLVCKASVRFCFVVDDRKHTSIYSRDVYHRTCTKDNWALIKQNFFQESRVDREAWRIHAVVYDEQECDLVKVKKGIHLSVSEIK